VIAKTDRVILRRWRDSDREPFARMNADPRVMEYFPAPRSTEESNRLVDQFEADFLQHGFGLCAAELVKDHSFIGYIGLAVPKFSTHTPCVEIGYRLAAEHWGQGLATEGAREMARQAFDVLGLKELVSFTVPANVRSRSVMEKLGMTHGAADDFDHPNLPVGHPLRRHVLYRLRRGDNG
jgi:RimJ/RimL family protein N-acetyltransferase